MNITLEAYGDQVIAFNFAHLQQYLSQLPGTRSNRGKVYSLAIDTDLQPDGPTGGL